MNVQVILREDVPNLGQTGEVVKVRAGYARNYLLPRNLAVEANTKNLREFEHHKRVTMTKREANKNVLRALDTVSERLGNTRTVCRKYYVHPELIRAYFDGQTPSLPTRPVPREYRRQNPPPALRRDEVAVLEFLQDL